MRAGPATLSRGATIRFLQVLLAASVLVPLLLMGGAAWLSYRSAFAQADQQLWRTLDVVQEHAVKVFETQELVLGQAAEIVRELTDEEIRADEAALHQRLRELIADLPQVHNLWLVDRSGRLLVGAGQRVTQALDLSDRDYFRAHSDNTASGTFVGDVLQARSTGVWFFDVSRRRRDPGGAFAGVVVASVRPEYFITFFERLGELPGYSLSLSRLDGARLAFYPRQPPGPFRAPPESRFMQEIRAKAQGIYEAPSLIDGRPRTVAFRQLPKHPITVSVGYPHAVVLAGWREGLLAQLAFGIPATLALVLITGLALRQARREEAALALVQAEMVRRETVEGQLRQVQRLEAVGQLTSGVAHDFNNLLTAVLGNLDFLERNPADPRNPRRIVAMREAAERGTRLTGQLLAFSRRQRLEPKPVDLNQVVAGMSDLLKSSIGGTVRVETVLKTDLWPALVDPTQIELVILNLAVNARDAMAVGGTLVIETANVALGPAARSEEPGAGDYVMVAVNDTGAGMSEAVRAKVFEPFFTTKEIGKGSGLGLSQVYGVVKQLGGGVRIDSTPGEGTSVKVYLPRAQGAALEAERAPEDDVAALALALRGLRVLLVDDDAEVRHVTASLLEEFGCLVSQAGSGRAALDLMAASPAPAIELALLDFAMPGMNGAEVAAALLARRPDLPVVYVTGYADTAALATTDEERIIQKPFRREELARKLARALGRETTADAANVVVLRTGTSATS